MRLGLLLVSLAVAVGVTGARAQTAPTAPVVASIATAPCCLIPSGAVVDIELAQLVSSKTSRPGDHFKIRLAHDLVFKDHVILAAGAEGLGEVVDCAPSGLAGRGGKLVLAARFVESGDVHLPLRGFRLSGSGRDDSKTVSALAVAPYVGVLAFAVHGGNIDYPAGTQAQAKVLADILITPPSALPAAPSSAPPQPAVEKAP